MQAHLPLFSTTAAEAHGFLPMRYMSTGSEVIETVASGKVAKVWKSYRAFMYDRLTIDLTACGLIAAQKMLLEFDEQLAHLSAQADSRSSLKYLYERVADEAGRAGLKELLVHLCGSKEWPRDERAACSWPHIFPKPPQPVEVHPAQVLTAKEAEDCYRALGVWTPHWDYDGAALYIEVGREELAGAIFPALSLNQITGTKKSYGPFAPNIEAPVSCCGGRLYTVAGTSSGVTRDCASAWRIVPRAEFAGETCSYGERCAQKGRSGASLAGVRVWHMDEEWVIEGEEVMFLAIVRREENF